MKSMAFVRTLMLVSMAAFCLITWSGFAEAAEFRGGGGGPGTTSNISQSGNTLGSPSASQGYSTGNLDVSATQRNTGAEMTIKIPPEYTRWKKGSGKMDPQQ